MITRTRFNFVPGVLAPYVIIVGILLLVLLNTPAIAKHGDESRGAEVKSWEATEVEHERASSEEPEMAKGIHRLAFVENQGQFDKQALYVARHGTTELCIVSQGFVMNDKLSQIPAIQTTIGFKHLLSKAADNFFKRR